MGACRSGVVVDVLLFSVSLCLCGEVFKITVEACREPTKLLWRLSLQLAWLFLLRLWFYLQPLWRQAF